MLTKADNLKLILLEEYTKATALISDMYKKDEISVSALQDWPLFEEYRLTKEYAEFKEEHYSDFTTVEIEFGAKSVDSDEKTSGNCEDVELID